MAFPSPFVVSSTPCILMPRRDSGECLHRAVLENEAQAGRGAATIVAESFWSRAKGVGMCCDHFRRLGKRIRLWFWHLFLDGGWEGWIVKLDSFLKRLYLPFKAEKRDTVQLRSNTTFLEIVFLWEQLGPIKRKDLHSICPFLANPPSSRGATVISISWVVETRRGTVCWFSPWKIRRCLPVYPSNVGTHFDNRCDPQPMLTSGLRFPILSSQEN